MPSRSPDYPAKVRLTTIDRAILARRQAKTNKAGTILYTFGQMVTGKLEPKCSYLGSLQAPISYPMFFLLVLCIVAFAGVFAFGAHPR